MFNKIKEMLQNNIQLNQTIILTFLLFVWVEFYDLNISYLEIFVTFSTVILLDAFFIKFRTWKWSFPFSWVNPWFWISFFLRSSDLILYVFAWILAIVWKNVFRINWRHFFNPSNMGVFLTLVLFPQFAWINTLQWGNYNWSITWTYLFALIVVFILGVWISLRVKKFFNFTFLYDLILPFFLLHSILFFIIPYSEDWSSYITFFSVSFFIFLFYMITDPKTVPEKSKNRVFYSISIVLTFYILQFFINEWYAILGSLFFNTLLLPYVWKVEKNTNNKTIDKSISFYLILISFMLVSLLILINLYGRPDLVFDNVCNQLICK